MGKGTFSQRLKIPNDNKMVMMLASTETHHFVGSTALNRKIIKRNVERRKPRKLNT
jgi:hypothetical protein